MRTLRAVTAAGAVLLAVACGSGGPAPAATSVAAATVPPTEAAGTVPPTSALPDSAPPSTTPPPLAAVPLRGVPACATVTCRAIAVVPDVRPGVHLALVRGPDREPVQQTAYLLTLDAAARPLHWRQLADGDVFFDDALPGLSCDGLAHCFVPAGVGAHGGVLNVVWVGVAGELTDLSQAGELSADTPDVLARDLDGDGIAEVLALQNDYQPNYASGSEYWMVWTWRGGRYVSLGCRPAQRGETSPSGPVSPAECPAP